MKGGEIKMARIEVYNNKEYKDSRMQNRKEVAQVDDILGHHHTLLGELEIIPTTSPDGVQEALLLRGDAMRGHGKHVKRTERMMQIGKLSTRRMGEIQLSPNKWLSISYNADAE